MLLFASLMVSALATNERRLDFQLMTSPAFQAFARKADKACPAQRMRYLHPADLDDFEEAFLEKLPRRERRAMTVNPADLRACPPAGLSCPAQLTLRVIIRAGKLDAFAQSACASR